ncbi:MAG: cytochrome P450 [Chloroflexota bacterium]
MKINHAAQSVSLDVRDPDFYNNPYPTYAQLRQEMPIFYWEEFDLWTFTRHEDVSAILRDRRFGRQITHLKSREELGWPPERADLKPFYDVDRHSMLDLEPPAHTRLRKLVHKAFMARQIERLRPQIAALSHRLIDEMEAQGNPDLLTGFATPIPVIVIAELLGVPTEMADQLLAWSHAMVRMYELARTPEMEQAAVAAAVDFASYLRGYVAQRRREPKDDLITKLIEVEEAGEKLSEAELISTCILLLNAGHEATVHVIGNGVYQLLQRPDQLRLWQENEGVTKTAVEELLRFDTPLHQFNRWVLEDLEYRGYHFRQGTQVSLLLGSANRDPQQFDQPDKLDLTRPKNPHVSLGGGIHFCLGAPLARLELQVALSILLQRLPNLQLAKEPRYRNTYHFHGLEELLVAW